MLLPLLVSVLVASAAGGSVVPSPNFDLKNPQTFWPPLGYQCQMHYDFQKQQSFSQAQIHCRNETSEQRTLLASKVRITDWKTCILWRLKGVVFDGATPVWRMNMGLRKSLLIIMSGLHKAGKKETDKRKAKVEELLKKCAPCANVLNTMLKNKLPTHKWEDFHNCVENAWKCETKKGVKQSNAPPPPSPAGPPSNWWAKATTRKP